MTNINQDKEEYAKAAMRHLHEEQLKRFIKEPLEEIIGPLLKGEGIPGSLLVDVTMLLIFVHINLLGYLSSGNDKTANAVKFFREYLGKIDARYKEVGGLLYHMLRHGWIHRFTPKRLKLNDGTILDFLYSFDMNRDQHLKMVEIQGDKKLRISLSLLYYDALSAIDLFAKDIRRNQELSDVFKKAFETRRKPEEENDIRVRYKSYLRDSDFNFIYRLLNEGH